METYKKFYYRYTKKDIIIILSILFFLILVDIIY